MTEEVFESSLLDYSVAKTRIKRLIDDWVELQQRAERNRKLRKIEINVKEERQRKRLEADETVIPIRVINTNISRERPQLLNFIKGTDRLIILEAKNAELSIDIIQKLEQEFTKGMRYNGWEMPLLQEYDGAATHGWSSVEVVYDSNKPLHVGIEYIPYDMMLFPRKVRNIQDSELILVKKKISPGNLRALVDDYGFDPKQVSLLLDNISETNIDSTEIDIYKKFCRYNGIIYVAWYSEKCEDWLKEPVPHYVGISEQTILSDPITGVQSVESRAIPLESYPIFVLGYEPESENEIITKQQGRVFLDEYKQSAQTSIWSSVVNALNRAAHLYASAEKPSQTGAAPKILDLALVPNRFYSEPIKFFSPQFPPYQFLQAAQALDVETANEQGQISFAANNRVDSRKTAAEVEAAQSKEIAVTGSKTISLGVHLGDVFGFAFSIVKSQAEFDKVPLLREGGRNNVQFYKDITFNVKSSGETDVINRQQKTLQMKQDWPVMAQTPIAMSFLANLIRLSYPEEAAEYLPLLQQGNPLNLVAAMLKLFQTLVTPQLIEALPPEEQAAIQKNMPQMMQIIGAAQQATKGISNATNTGLRTGNENS